ncbi:hypothetical protein GQ457_02G035660 [Hibiscus cannabinus]
MEAVAIGAAANTSSEAAKGILHQVKRHMRYVIFYQKIVHKFEEKHKSLIAKRTSLQQDVDAAERNGEKIKADVLDWRNRVDKVITEEEKKVKALEVKAKSKCLFGLCPSIKSRYRLSRKAEGDATTFDDLIKEYQFDRVGYRDVPEAIIHTGFETFESREKLFNDIMESLKVSTTTMIGVHGMPGVGKTSLVQEVERQLQEVKLFNSVVMATVSQAPDIKKIQDQIAESLGLKLEENTPVVRARRLCERLKKEKNVVIILDDIWTKLDLEGVGIPFGSQHRGCKILLTSRNKNILCNEMDATETFVVGDLDEEEAWEFFKKMAGDCVESADFRPTAIEIANRCARLPLAIATVARALRNKSIFIWRDALRQLQRPYSENSSEISAKVYSAIELSINHLPSEDLKQTFLLCSLLRRSTRIEDLLRYAIGLGLIRGVNSLKEGRDRLLTMMSTLKEYCLLSDSNTDDQFFDVHDLTYIVAKSIASKDNQVFGLNQEDVLTDWPGEESLKKLNKICLQYPSINNLPDQLNCPQLFLFLLFSKDLSLTLSADFFKEATNIKVLNLTSMRFSSLPSSICLLTGLSTLCLDQCKLGDDITIIGGLKSLEILSLSESDIRILPKEIGQMVKLKLLDVTWCGCLKMISPGVLSSLTRLEELYMGGTSIQWGESRTASLAELSTLSLLSTLEVQIPDAKAAPQDFFQELQRLEKYKIFIGEEWEWEWFGKYNYSRTLKLRLSANVDDLDRGIKKLSKKTEDLHLDELKSVKIALQELTDEESLSHLKNLHIQNGLDTEYIINDENEFPQLQSLTLQSLPQLISFCPQYQTNSTDSLPQHELPLFSEKISFPCLEKLWLKSINVTRLWHNQLSTTSYGKLTTLKIEGCGSLKHLFSFSMAKCLLHLTDFEIIGCHCLREIIFMEEIEEAQATMNLPLFPQLKSLELKDLRHLIGFCSDCKTQVINFPAMKSLRINNCPELEGFICGSSMEGNRRISSQVLIDNKVAFPSLEEMSISYLRRLKMLWQNPLPPNSFSKLQQLTVEGCDELLSIFPSNMLSKFQGLQTLRVKTCASLEQVFEIMHEEKEAALPVTSQLREFHIFKLPKLKYIWKNDPKGIFSFINLRQISVMGCWSLKNVFPASVARDLPQLGDLVIFGCGVEEIVSNVEQGLDSETTITFEFDQLSSLTLCMLPRCKCFYPGRHTTKWPMLKELQAYQCGQMKMFDTQLIIQKEQLDSPPPLFWVEKVIPKLQRLTLSGDYIAMISGGQFSSSLFHEIKAFRVEEDRAKSVYFPISFLERFYNLEELCFADCEIKELFWTEGDTGRTLSTIRKLELVGLYNMKDYLWKQDVQVHHILPNLETLEVYKCENLMSLGSSSASFQNLTTLKVWDCKGMKYLDTCVAVQGLSQLKKLIIGECISMKEIVASEEDEAKCDIIFSRLISLEFVNLPRLKSFCWGNHTFGFPCLEEVIVSGCPELEIFCKGVLNAPLLQSVEYDEGTGCWSGDLDSTVQQLHSTKTWFHGIRDLVLSEFAKSTEIWKEYIQGSLDFKNVVVLKVEECNSLKYIFRVSMALDLVQLEHITVKNCPMIKQIIKKGVEETAMDTVHLRKLKMIKLESCSELTSFCRGNITLQSPSLKIIEVDDCPKMYAMVSPREVGGAEKTPFLNDKVICANLEMLKLSWTNIQKLWPDKPNSAIPSNVRTLRSLIVNGCHNLEYLFPSFLIKNFVRLSALGLFNCENMKHVIFSEEEGTTEIYLFAELRLLYLGILPKLGTFCHGDNSETGDTALFNEKVRFPRLNDLRIVGIGKCRKIWQHKVAMDSFYELSYLQVVYCERLLSILPFSVVERLEKLETLEICRCESVERIIEPEDDHRFNSNEATSTKSIELKSTNIKTVFPKIRELNLEMLPKLKGFYSKVHTTEWPSLKQLKVSDCGEIESLAGEYINFGETQGQSQPLRSVQQPLFWITEEAFPNLEELHLIRNGNMKEIWHGPHPNQYLFNLRRYDNRFSLKRMCVTNCQMIEEILASTTDEFTDVLDFNQLKSLELDRRGKLSRFCSVNYASVFPTLKEVFIEQCPKMEFFLLGELTTQMLYALQSTNDVHLWEGTLDAIIQQFLEKTFQQHQAKEEMTNQKLFSLLEFLLLTRFCHGNYFEFPLLTSLLIQSCPTLKTLLGEQGINSQIASLTLFDEKVMAIGKYSSLSQEYYLQICTVAVLVEEFQFYDT